MAITDRTRKILWAKSGNRCALCMRELVIDANDDDDESVVGDECHIRSPKPDGPRHAPSHPEQRLDTVDNLILLCRVHHKMVDDQVNTYTVERLTQLKADHEAWVSETLDSLARPGRPRQIPSPPGDFVGREEEIREILENINDRGTTISGVRGMGGIGKTALAYVVAERLKAGFDAHFYLDLKGSGAQPLAPAEAQAHVLAGYQPEAKLPDDPAQLAGLYRSVLSDRPALLLMDNAADRAQVEPLIPPAGCVMLVTSRQYFELPGWFAKNLDTLPLDKARELLTSIAPRVVPTDDAEQGQLDRIAALCGFLPLAVRLAGGALASRPDLTPAAYIARLVDERERLDQFDEVRAAVRASEGLLDEPSRRLWWPLAVFPGDFDLLAAAAVWELDEAAADRVIGTLLAFSLLTWSAETRRYRLHDLVRIYAGQQLADDERRAAQYRHAAHYCQVAAEAGHLYLYSAEGATKGLALFDLEWPNIATGFAWAQANVAMDDEAARLCSDYPAVGVYCRDLRQHPRANVAWLEAGLAAARRLHDKRAEGRHLGNLGNAHGALGEPRRAIECYEKQLTIARAIGDRRCEGNALGNFGLAYTALGEPRRAMEFYRRRLTIAGQIGDRRGEGNALGNLGNAYLVLGEPRRAIQFYEQQLAIAREIGDRRGEAQDLGNLGNAHLALGRPRGAIEFYEQYLATARAIGDRRGAGNALGSLGRAHGALGEPRRAIQFYEQCLKIFCETGDRRGAGNAMGNLGNAYFALGEARGAIAFHGRQLTITREIGDRRGEAIACWNAGLVYSELGDLARAVELMQVRVDYEREIGHPDAEKRAALVAKLRERVQT